MAYTPNPWDPQSLEDSATHLSWLKRLESAVVSAGGGGNVNSVTATDASVVVAGSASAPTVATNTLDVIAAQHPPAADWSNNSKKITNLAAPVAGTDAATATYAAANGPVSSVVGRTGAVTGLADLTSGSTQTFTAAVAAPDFAPSGLTGAVQSSRYVGATTSGAPASGSFSVGDYVVDRSGKFWICTTAGSPGTWTNTASGVPAFFNILDAAYGATRYTSASAAAAGTDSTSAIQTAINAAIAAGGGTVYIPQGFYRIATHLNVNASNVAITGAGMSDSVLVFDDVSDYAIDFTATLNVSASFTSQTLAKGARAVTLGSGQGASFTVGDQVMVNDATLMPGGTTSYTRWITRIAKIATDTITFTERSPVTYATSPGTVQKCSTGFLAGVRVSDVTLMVYDATYNTIAANRAMGLRIQGCWGAVIERVEFLNFSGTTAGSPLYLNYSRGTRVAHCRWEKILDPAAVQPATASTPVYIIDCTAAQFLGCYMEKCGFGPAFTRSPYCAVIGCDIGGATDYNAVTNIATDTGGRGIQTQGGDNYLRIVGNHIHDFAYDGISLHDCSYAFIVGNQIVDCNETGIFSAPWNGSSTFTYCNDLQITDNVIDKTVSTSRGAGLQISGQGALVANNTILNTQNYGIVLDGTGHVVEGNRINGYCQAGAGLAGIGILSTGQANVYNNYLTGNGGGGCLSLWHVGGTNVCRFFGNQTDTSNSFIGTDILFDSPASSQATPANPTGTSSTTGVMMGLAGSITPSRSGKVLIQVSGDIFNATAIADGGKAQIRWGTGSAPTNGAALTGTTAGGLVQYIAATTAEKAPFSLNAVVTGLTLGTAVWIDLGLAAITGGTATVNDISISAIEL